MVISIGTIILPVSYKYKHIFKTFMKILMLLWPSSCTEKKQTLSKWNELCFNLNFVPHVPMDRTGLQKSTGIKYIPESIKKGLVFFSKQLQYLHSTYPFLLALVILISNVCKGLFVFTVKKKKFIPKYPGYIRILGKNRLQKCLQT